MDHPFRSAAVGGFNRQDVLAYLEERAKLAAQAEQKLQDQLDEVNHQAEALRRERDGLRCELEETRRELEAPPAPGQPVRPAGAEGPGAVRLSGTGRGGGARVGEGPGGAG